MAEENHDKDFENYKDKLSYLQKSMLIFIGVILFFFFMILLPYYSLKSDAFRLYDIDKDFNDTVIKNLRSAELSSDKLNNQISHFYNNKFADYNIQIQKYSSQLQYYLAQNQSYEGQLSKLSQNKPLTAIDKRNMTNINQILSTIRKNITDVSAIINSTAIRNNRLSLIEIGTLQNLKQNVSGIRQELNDIINNLDKLQNKATDLIDLSFFDYFKNQMQVAMQLLDNVNGNFTIFINSKTLQPKTSLSTNLHSSLDQLIRNGFSNQKTVLTKGIKNATSELMDRFKNLEAPVVGKLPIGFNEMVAIFPFALTLGFYFCSSILCDTIRLGKYLHDAKTLKDHLASNEYVSIIAPSWFDPTKPLLNQITSLSILIIPAIIFGISVYSIASIWSNFIRLTDAFPAFAAARILNEWIYTVLYGASVLLFAYCYYKIIKEYRKASSFTPMDVLVAYRNINVELRKLFQKNPQLAYSLLRQIIELNNWHHLLHRRMFW